MAEVPLELLMTYNDHKCHQIVLWNIWSNRESEVLIFARLEDIKKHLELQTKQLHKTSLHFRK